MIKELVTEYPVIAAILIAIPIIGAIWKAMHALYVAPRDFKIKSMEKDINDLRNELLNLEKRSTPPSQIKQNETAVEISEPPEQEIIKEVSEIHPGTLKELLDLWHNKELTDLQKQHLEEVYTGKEINWEVKVTSISDEEDGKIWLTIYPPDNDNYYHSAMAIFTKKDKEALLMVKKNETFYMSGKIDRFFLSPVITNCTITRV